MAVPLDLNLMRESGRILSITLSSLQDFIAPGVSTLDVSLFVEHHIRKLGGAPAFLGYHGFPAAACVSVNSQVVHAIPRGDLVLRSGDIVSVDVGVIYREHFSDACRTLAVGPIPKRTADLLRTTEMALAQGIKAAGRGAHLSDISYAIQRHVERHRFNVSRDYTGHGIGRALHLEPLVPNFGFPGRGPTLEVGSCLAIEPVVFDGPTEVLLDRDGWTVYSRRGNLSAHFEDTILIAEEGPEIITRSSA